MIYDHNYIIILLKVFVKVKYMIHYQNHSMCFHTHEENEKDNGLLM